MSSSLPISLSDYDYDLPHELIAQFPLANRADARMMVIDRKRRSIDHVHVRDLPDFVEAGDALVLNDSRVIPAALVGYRNETRGRWKGLFLQCDSQGVWRLLCKTRGKMKPGELVTLQDRESRDACQLQMLQRLEGGQWAARPVASHSGQERPGGQERPVLDLLNEVGRVPLPHYIRNGQMVTSDLQTYQTIYAKEAGSVAAPTAGLHFTKTLLQSLKQQGAELHAVTLHVGIGTFRPVTSDTLEEHQMHAEFGNLSADAASALRKVQRRANRIFAVGTTSARLLETAARGPAGLAAWSGETDLFIKPGFQFRAVDCLLTNFHLPRSTLLVLARTFGGDELIRKAYAIAVDEQYRFFSYGDAMLIL